MNELYQFKLTKRKLLSNIATIFDPLGFLAPISFLCKTWMQQLWTDNLDWDQQISPEVEKKWTQLSEELPLINDMAVPRWIHYHPECRIEIHGFCDASEKGYAAVIYSCVTNPKGEVNISLLCAKSRVAPLKNKMTLPRMELAGALLLSQLVTDSLKDLMLDDVPCHFWCDSQIALAWIAKQPSTWTTFVANRVAAIQQLTGKHPWRYVNTKENPADIASRGCSVSTLNNHVPEGQQGRE